MRPASEAMHTPIPCVYMLGSVSPSMRSSSLSYQGRSEKNIRKARGPDEEEAGRKRDAAHII